MRMACMALIALAATSAAHAGDRVGNGGDICEDRIKIIRDDIRSWIERGGSEGLRLPAGLTLSRYDKGILGGISKATVSCTSRRIELDGAEKTCENFVDSRHGPQLVCNAARFQATSQSDQYVLVHHEYAGLAGFEVNRGPSSDYSLSNQLTEYLKDEVVKKLAVRQAFSPAPELSGGNSYETLKKAFDTAGPAQVADIPLLSEVLRKDSNIRCVIAKLPPDNETVPPNSRFAFGRIDDTSPARGPLLPKNTISKIAPAISYDEEHEYSNDQWARVFDRFWEGTDVEILKTFVNTSGDLESIYSTFCAKLDKSSFIYRKRAGMLFVHATGWASSLSGDCTRTISSVTGYGYCYPNQPR